MLASFEIVSASYLKAYKIQILFTNHQKKIIDFQSFLENSNNPVFKKYLDLNCFRNFKFKHGDIIWNNYEMVFPVKTWYKQFMQRINRSKDSSAGPASSANPLNE